MTVTDYINITPEDRQELLNAIHKIIIANDPSVNAVIKPMMGKEMILYEQQGYMKYGLSSVKSHMSLHCLPIYMDPQLHAKYLSLLPDAKVQKGCVNFTDETDLPLTILANLITDCSAVNIATVLENRKKK